jgi:lysophospholipase L1-like esterase
MKLNAKKNNLAKFIFIAFIVLFVFNIYYFFAKRSVGPLYYLEKIFQTDNDNILEKSVYQSLSQEYSVLNKNYKRKDVIVFLGDSITKRFNLDEISDTDYLLNRGIFYDTTLGVLKRLNSNVNNLNIKMLFIMIGYNDLKYRDNQRILENIGNILSKARASKVIVQSLLPVDSKRKLINQRIVRLNKQIQLIAQKKGYLYIDLHSKFVTNQGGINKRYSLDGTHPNIEGYKLWYSIIKPYLYD